MSFLLTLPFLAGNVGTCHGGSVSGPYQWLYDLSRSTGSGISYFSANPYLACSSESQEGFCPQGDWTCTPENIARTFSTFTSNGGKCVGLNRYPNATISAYGSVTGNDNMKNEIYHRGSIACGIDAGPLVDYTTGVLKAEGNQIDHVISVTGWSVDEQGTEYWFVR